MGPSISLFLAYVGATLAAVQAFAVAAQRGRTLPRLAFILGMLALAAESAFAGLGLDAQDPEELSRWYTCRLLATACLVAPWTIFGLRYARGDQRRVYKGSRIFVILLGAAPLVASAIWHDHLVVLVRETEAGAPAIAELGRSAFVLHLLILSASVVILANLERVYRASVGTVRWRIKFMVLGVGLIFTVRLFTASHAVLTQTIDPATEVVNVSSLVIGCVLIFRSLFRSGHFETDVYPSPKVLQSSVTLVLAGAYLVLVGLLWKSEAFDGPEAFGIKAFLILLALAGLAGALQSDRAQWQVRNLVSRHFQRPFYDYRSAWRSFTDATATILNPDELSRALVKIVAGLFQAKSVAIWLTRDEAPDLYCAASSADGKTPVVLAEEEVAALMSHFRAHPEPVAFEAVNLTWAATLRTLHPKLFRKGGDRIAAPLLAGGRLIGFLLLGDRITGGGLSVQDSDMLRCAADQAAGSLLNLQLTERSLQQRELAAFQSMATFFVHDLKNAASTLNLMLPNLPVHWNNPEFREDALRGISKTVGHINAVVGRLGQLRKGLASERSPVQLNALLEEVLAGWQSMAGWVIAQSLEPLPAVSVDREQLRTVIGNLLLNARDAMTASNSEGGQVSVATRAVGPWAVLSVTDNGCGMSEEFVQHSLFKPFHTTKKEGLGIGMFQCKMIVEAHGGRLTVKSTLGAGTTVQVFLPIPHEEAARGARPAVLEERLT